MTIENRSFKEYREKYSQSTSLPFWTPANMLTTSHHFPLRLPMTISETLTVIKEYVNTNKATELEKLLCDILQAFMSASVSQQTGTLEKMNHFANSCDALHAAGKNNNLMNFPRPT